MFAYCLVAVSMVGFLGIAVLGPPLIVGVVLGYYLRGKKLFMVGKLVSGIILILIFSLGFSIGSNTELLAIMPSVAFNALVLLVMALFFSMLFAKVVVKLVRL